MEWFYKLDDAVIRISKVILNFLNFDEIRIFLSLFDNELTFSKFIFKIKGETKWQQKEIPI